MAEFRKLAQRDLQDLINAIVPSDSLQGIKLNSGVTAQILGGWRAKRLLPQEQLTPILTAIEERKRNVASQSTASRREGGEDDSSRGGSASLTKEEIFRRIEEDRERHKRIREKLWVLPPKAYVDAIPDLPPSAGPSSQAKKQRLSVSATAAKDSTTALEAENSTTTLVTGEEDIHEIQFEELWEATSDLNEDDLAQWREEEEERWWGSETILARRREEAERTQREEQEKRQAAQEAAAAAERERRQAEAAEARNRPHPTRRDVMESDRDVQKNVASAYSSAWTPRGGYGPSSGGRNRDWGNSRRRPDPEPRGPAGPVSGWQNRPPPPGPPPPPPMHPAAGAAPAAQAAQAAPSGPSRWRDSRWGSESAGGGRRRW